MSKPNEPQPSPRFPETSALAPLTRKRAQELAERDPFRFTGFELVLLGLAGLALTVVFVAAVAPDEDSIDVVEQAASISWIVWWVLLGTILVLRGVSAQREQMYWWKRAQERLAERDDETDGETP